MNYLCIAIRSLSLSDDAKGSSKNIFEKSYQKIWWFQKYELPLQPISTLSVEWFGSGSSKKIRIWFFEDIEQLKFYLSPMR